MNNKAIRPGQKLECDSQLASRGGLRGGGAEVRTGQDGHGTSQQSSEGVFLETWRRCRSDEQKHDGMRDIDVAVTHCEKEITVSGDLSKREKK